MNQYPHAPALGCTSTSRAAAHRINPHAKRLQKMVLENLEHVGAATWKEVSARLHKDTRSVQPRFSELKKLGMIEDTGDRRDGCAVMMVRP